MKDFVDQSGSKDEGAGLTVAEARAFFENQITEAATRSDKAENSHDGLYSGDFTPRWDKAIAARNRVVDAVDVPVSAQYRFRATRSEFVKGKASAYTVDAPQKLVIFKSKKTQKTYQYILTLIPDKNYNSTNKGKVIDRFIHAGNKGGFSGIALYTKVATGKLVRAERFKDGNRTQGITFTGDKAKLSEKNALLKQMLGSISLVRLAGAAATRGGTGTEDDPIEIDEVVVIGYPGGDDDDEDPFDWGDDDDPYGGEEEEEEEPCGLCGSIDCDGSCFWEDGEPTGQTPGNPPSPPQGPNVTVQNGYCPIGALAAAIQAITGCTSASAIAQATAALQAAGVNTSTLVNGGLFMSGAQMTSALQSLGYTVDSNPMPTGTYIGNWLNSGGYGLGHINGNGTNTIGHDVYVTGYGSGTFSYYDPVLGTYGTVGPNGWGNGFEITLFK